ncbi:MAG: excinuclease ABC subunit UvrA [Candidatus Omnitrophica bacterium]|nr:excinuclease ABC subunit UvrA [Candidatus Omnitrophota bacterium]
MASSIIVSGAREHNLKNINVEIPRNQFTVITGLSGSGKSSLAFDTIYAEGQRRYIECLSSYARQFLEKLKKPEVDHISGLSPSISIEQKSIVHNPRSTVATVTEIYDYLRLLYAKVADVFCYKCGSSITSQSSRDMVNQIFALPRNARIVLYAPIVRGRKGEYKKEIEEIRKKGFSKVRIDGKIYSIDDEINLSKSKRHDIDILIDIFMVHERYRDRMTKSVELALEASKGSAIVALEPVRKRKDAKERELFFSRARTCPKCQVSIGELTPNVFSFNSPYGACPKCRGIGRVSQILSGVVIQDPTKPLLKGALNEEINFSFNSYFIEDLVWEIKQYYKPDLNLPFQELPGEVQDAFFWGNDEFPGLFDELRDLSYRTTSTIVRDKIKKFLVEDVCHECKGGRLKRESMGVLINGKNIVEICGYSVEASRKFFDALTFDGSKAVIGDPILKEIRDRLHFLDNVGLDYLTLDRPVTTLAGGELQRIRLAAQIGIGLTGVLYVLDEPSIGLHPRDHERLLATLKELRDMRNTILVVEHDEETIRSADYVVDLGPKAGIEGGEVVAAGSVEEICKNEKSLTGNYLTGRLEIPVPKKRKSIRGAHWLSLKGAKEHNLKNVSVEIPLGLFICVTGVSGSGKSTLIHDVLFKALHNEIWKTHYPVGKFKKLEGVEHLDKVIEIDQSPIGRTPRSNPATYTDLFVYIRKLFADAPEAKVRNFSQSRFSFNLKGGRCETCQGEGYQKLEMSFLPDLYVLCEACRGKRYNDQTLEIQYKGKNIAEVLDMPVTEALGFFKAIPQLRERLEWLEKIGLGYIKLGQPSTTLSGGEAQRVKLAAELAKKATGKTLYLLDEPTTGLHFADIDHLLKAIFGLREAGNTVIVIEHNMDVVKSADYVIDLGPDGGDDGGRIIAEGAPEAIVKSKKSHTGYFLARMLKTGGPG